MFIRPTSFQPLSSDNVEYSGVKFIPASDGSVDVVESSEAPAPLPSYDSLQLDNMLASGVPLERVNPHIIGTSSMSEFSAAKKIYDVVESSQPTPVEPTPVEPTPVEPTPVEPTPVQ